MSRMSRALTAAVPAVTLAWLIWIIDNNGAALAPDGGSGATGRERHSAAPGQQWLASDDASDTVFRPMRPAPQGGPVANPDPVLAAAPMTLEEARRRFPSTDPRLFAPHRPRRSAWYW